MMVTGLISGPNRIPDLPGKAFGMPGVYAVHDPEVAARIMQEYRTGTQPVIYYPPTLPTDSREGRLFSVAQKMPDFSTELQMGKTLVDHETAPEGEGEVLPGVQLELVHSLATPADFAPAAEAEVIESLAA